MASINLPFPGFYESIYSGEIDHAEEMEVEHVLEREREERAPELRLNSDEVYSILRDATDYAKAYDLIARDYVETFSRVVGDELGVELGLVFEEMTSPRYYNFETDRIFATIKDEAVAALFKMSAGNHHTILADVIRSRFTSYDGFHSHYSNDLRDWLSKPVAEWDHNELGTLLIACCKLKEIDYREAVYYDIANGEGFYHAYTNSVAWEKVEADMNELRDDKIAEFKELNPDYVPPPERCPYTLDLFQPNN